jgi:hypothetical protein
MLAVREQHRLREFQKRVIRLLGPKKDGMQGLEKEI